MADEQIIRLLAEIRELQKEHLAHYKIALQNQQEAMATQKRAVGEKQDRLDHIVCASGLYRPLLLRAAACVVRQLAGAPVELRIGQPSSRSGWGHSHA
jgi:2-iminoacetate synthase ThiH